MYPPRFPHPNYVPHQRPHRPHGPRFNQRWPMQHTNHPNSIGNNYPIKNEKHWCETCDRGFRTLEILINHKQQHQKCNIDGCQFIAHPKVITKHIQMQHSTGLYKKIAKLDNPEEIQKWREERKKRYPTKENIEKKCAEIKEKINRGEKMGMRSHRINKPTEREKGIKRKGVHDNNKRNFKRRLQANKSFNEDNNKIAIDDNNKKPLAIQNENKVDDSKTLKPFAGILNLLNDTDTDNVSEDIEISDAIEDDEYILMDQSNEKNISITTEPVVCGALTSLMCNYESSDEEPVSNNTQLQDNQSEISNTRNSINKNTTGKPNETLQINISILNASQKSDDDSGPEEAKIVKVVGVENNTEGPISNSKEPNLDNSKTTERREKQEYNRINKTRNGPKSFKSKLPSTLLEKLLRNEIRQERNIILQCIRYIVKNNYFEKDEKFK